MKNDYYRALIAERGEAEAAALLADECRKRDAMIGVLKDACTTVLHQVSTDSDLDDKVSAPWKYDALERVLREAVGLAEKVIP
jgi:hypothetical protein